MLAWLAFTRAPGQAIPMREAIAVIDDTSQPAAVRAAAVMAISFAQAEQPRAWAKLHEIARQPDHPGFPSAVSRLADIGEEFTLAHLRRVASIAGASPQAKLLGRADRAAREPHRAGTRRARGEERASPPRAHRLGRSRMRHPSRPSAARGRRTYLAARITNPEVRAIIEQIERSYEPAPGIDPYEGPTRQPRRRPARPRAAVREPGARSLRGEVTTGMGLRANKRQRR
jgi:hypothetical protein